ncbi:PLC-like phosphodiesterase [Mycena vulgaris]|nr:PLC-like phosphodiesterase [Mycena vulgaris]
MNIKLRLQDIPATKKSNSTMGWFDNVINDVVKVAEEVASGAGDIVTQGVEVVKEVANDAGDIAIQGVEVVKDVANETGMIVTQGYRSTAREVHEFVNDPDPMRIVKAPLNIVGDVAERLPAVGDLVHSLRNPAPGDRSNWMRENKAHLENKRLYQISMPGTHDSGTFDLSHRDALDAQNTVSGLSKFPVTTGVVHDWAKAQELDFVGQLSAGVRFFDLRIGVSKHDESLRIVHSLESNQTLRELLEPMGRWMHDHPDEIIILDIQHSYGLKDKPNRVQDLIATFRDIFTGLYVTKSRLEQHATYTELIESRDRVVILCDNKDLLSSQADYFIHRDDFFATYNWNGNDERPTNGNRKMYGIGLSFSPPESPSTADEYATYATSSLKKWGAEKQNPLAIGRLKNLSLGGRGWIIILDFPEYPNMDVIDYTIDLNK